MTEVVKVQGFAPVHPVTLGYVRNPVPVELHVSPLSPPPRAFCPYPAVAVSGDPRASRAVSRDNTILA